MNQSAEPRLREELENLKRKTGMGSYLGILWIPLEDPDRHGEVKGDVILIYDKDEEGSVHPHLYAIYVCFMCFICFLIHERSFLVSRARPHLPQEMGVPERVWLNDKRASAPRHEGRH